MKMRLNWKETMARTIVRIRVQVQVQVRGRVQCMGSFSLKDAPYVRLEVVDTSTEFVFIMVKVR